MFLDLSALFVRIIADQVDAGGRFQLGSSKPLLNLVESLSLRHYLSDTSTMQKCDTSLKISVKLLSCQRLLKKTAIHRT